MKTLLDMLKKYTPRTIVAFGAIALLLVSSCSKEYDDSSIKASISRLEQQVTALQNTLNAYANNLMISYVSPSADGYHIVFSDGSSADVMKSGGSIGAGVTLEYIKEISVESGSVIFILTDGRSFKIPFESPGINIIGSPQVAVPAEGGNVELKYLSNVGCKVSIENSAASWIKVLSTKAMAEHSVTLSVNANSGLERNAKVTVSSDDGSISATYSITQEAGEVSDKMLSGSWYLHFVQINTTTYVFPSLECLKFNGNVMEWTGHAYGEPDEIYDLTYNDDHTCFLAVERTNHSLVHTFTILKHTDKILVIGEDGTNRYLYPSRSEADNASTDDLIYPDPVDPNHTETSDINTLMKYRYGDTHSDKTPMGRKFENAHVTTDADKTWLADATKNPSGADGWTRWSQRRVSLYPFGKPVPADCNQHSIGDCSAIAVFAEMSYLFPDFIKNIITDNGDDTYTVKMFDPQGTPVEVCVNNYFLMDNSGNIAQCTGKNEIPSWATIFEKAMMKWEEIYKVDEIRGIGSEFVSPLFTGNGDSFAFAPGSIYPSESLVVLKWALGEGKICIGGFNRDNLMCDELPAITYHAFSLMYTRKSDFLFSMRNPWGNGGELDGILNIPNEKTHIYAIDMRIIDPGAAKPYLVENLGPYVPPTFSAAQLKYRVSERLLATGE